MLKARSHSISRLLSTMRKSEDMDSFIMKRDPSASQICHRPRSSKLTKKKSMEGLDTTSDSTGFTNFSRQRSSSSLNRTVNTTQALKRTLYKPKMTPQDLEADISLNKVQLRQIYKEIEYKSNEKKNLQKWIRDLKGQLTRMQHQLKTNMVSSAPLVSSANQVWRDTYFKGQKNIATRQIIQSLTAQVPKLEEKIKAQNQERECLRAMSEAQTEQICQLKDFIKFARAHLNYEGRNINNYRGVLIKQNKKLVWQEHKFKQFEREQDGLVSRYYSRPESKRCMLKEERGAFTDISLNVTNNF